MSPVSKITNLETTTQLNLLKDPSSNRVNHLLLNETIPVTLYNNLSTFRDTEKKFELKEDLLKKITNENYNVELAILSDEKIMYQFGKETYFDIRALAVKSMRDK